MFSGKYATTVVPKMPYRPSYTPCFKSSRQQSGDPRDHLTKLGHQRSAWSSLSVYTASPWLSNAHVFAQNQYWAHKALLSPEIYLAHGDTGPFPSAATLTFMYEIIRPKLKPLIINETPHISAFGSYRGDNQPFSTRNSNEFPSAMKRVKVYLRYTCSQSPSHRILM